MSKRLVDAITEAWIAMNYMGDVLNACDMADEVSEAICNPAFEAIKAACPWVESIDIGAEHRKRWSEVVATCKICGADIQWNEGREVVRDGSLCMSCSHAATSQRPDEEAEQSAADTATAEDERPA